MRSDCLSNVVREQIVGLLDKEIGEILYGAVLLYVSMMQNRALENALRPMWVCRYAAKQELGRGRRRRLSTPKLLSDREPRPPSSIEPLDVMTSGTGSLDVCSAF